VNMRHVTALEVDSLATGRHDLLLDVTPLADGSVMAVPVSVIAGAAAGPRLVLVAGVHGDEPDGMLALVELAAALDPARLAGRLVIVPVANPTAFAAARRRSPLDEVDLNRAFPGSAAGTPSQQLAHRLLTGVIEGADFLFSLHSWSTYGETLSFVEVPDGGGALVQQSQAAARAAGFERIRALDWPDGLMVKVAMGRGIAGMEAEIGGQGATRAENRAAYRGHVAALMAHLGMVDGAVPAPRPYQALYRGRHVTAPCGGMVWIEAVLGDPVEAGAPLVRISDLFGATRAVVEAPVGGLLVVRRCFGTAAPGDHLATIFTPLEEVAP